MNKVTIRLKKFYFLCSFVFMICFLAGCGNGESDVEMQLESIENHVINIQDDARDAVGEMNEDVLQLERTGDQIDEE